MNEVPPGDTQYKSLHGENVGISGGGVLPTMAYTGRLRPKGVSFPRFRYMKG